MTDIDKNSPAKQKINAVAKKQEEQGHAFSKLFDLMNEKLNSATETMHDAAVRPLVESASYERITKLKEEIHAMEKENLEHIANYEKLRQEERDALASQAEQRKEQIARVKKDLLVRQQ